MLFLSYFNILQTKTENFTIDMLDKPKVERYKISTSPPKKKC